MLTVKIATDNAAFSDDNAREECASMMEDIARKLRDGYSSGPLLDSNGNTVGSFKLTV